MAKCSSSLCHDLHCLFLLFSDHKSWSVDPTGSLLMGYVNGCANPYLSLTVTMYMCICLNWGAHCCNMPCMAPLLTRIRTSCARGHTDFCVLCLWCKAAKSQDLHLIQACRHALLSRMWHVQTSEQLVIILFLIDSNSRASDRLHLQEMLKLRQRKQCPAGARSDMMQHQASLLVIQKHIGKPFC